MTPTTSLPGGTARRRCCLIALLLALCTLLGGCFTPTDYDTVITLPEGEFDDASASRKRGSASTKTGTGLDMRVDWVRENTELGESFRLTAYIVADTVVICSPELTGTLVINDEIYSFSPENRVVDVNDPVMWRLVVVTKDVYVTEGQPLHVLVTWPMNVTYNDKVIGDLTVEFDA